MFNCDICKQTEKPKKSQNKFASVVRKVIYPYRRDVNQFSVGGETFISDDYGGEGYEIVKEIVLCENCARVKRTPQILNDVKEF